MFKINSEKVKLKIIVAYFLLFEKRDYHAVLNVP